MSETPDEYEIIERTTPFQGYFRIDKYKLRHRCFDGGWTEPFWREVFERGLEAKDKKARRWFRNDETILEIVGEQGKLGLKDKGIEP